MVVRGRVQNGVVVLEEGVRLPEGQEVIVLEGASATAFPLSPGSPHSLLDIPSVSLGPVRQPPTAEDDLLEEMLDGRP
jgi:hypothetical protein